MNSIRSSLRLKFLLLFLALVVPGSAGFGAYFYKHSQRLMEKQLELRALTVAWTLAFNSRYAVMTGDQVVLEGLARGAIGSDDIAHVVITDGRGSVLLDRFRSDLPHDPTGPSGGGILEVEIPVDAAMGIDPATVDPAAEAVFDVVAPNREEAGGTIRLGISRSGLDAGMREALRASFLIFGLSTLLGMAVMLFFLRYIITPIRTLSKQMAKLAAGDFASELPSNRTDEIGGLARAFNEMAAGLRETRAGMKEAEEAMLQSSRLAAVGEVAGQAAHEILNPLAAVYGRLEHERHQLGTRFEPTVRVLRQIIEGWSAEYRKGGWPGLADSLSRSVPAREDGPGIALIEEDLQNLERILAELHDAARRRNDNLDFLLREVERVSRIVESMRSLSRAGANPERVVIGEVLSESLEVLRDSLDKRGVHVELDSAPEPLWVLADRSELVQIFTNLIRNAMQTIESVRGRGEGRIGIDIAAKGGLVEIAVADNGAGIAPEDRGRLFETTFTTKGPQEGTGLGLRICRRLARGARGDVRLASTVPGGGTTFIVALPRMNPS